jgi:hypothetical protein
MGSPYFVVDVQAVRRTPDGDDLGAQLMKYLGCDQIGRAVCTIHHDLHTLERQIVGESALAKFDITP